MAVIELHIDPTALIDIVVHPSALPAGTIIGDIVEIGPAIVGKGKAKALLYKVEKVEDESEKDSNNKVGNSNNTRRIKAQVIVNQQVATSFNWIKSRTEVSITLVIAPPSGQLTASHVELYFSAVYLSRSDMLRLSLALTNTALYLNQRVTLPGSLARLRVGGIYNLDRKQVRSAIVDDETKIVFRSESARSYVFIEVSQEMDHFEEDGSMLREKCELFLTELLSRIALTTNTVSIILYGRVIYEDNGEGDEMRAPLRKDEDGVLYRDFFKVILDLNPSPPPSIVRTVSSEMRSWNEQVLLRKTPSGEQKLSGRIAYAHESPVLEAVNLALNSFEEHWVDRDLQRTGLALIVLTAGTSFYQVPKSLLRLTTERMLYHGIGLDLISLSKTPLHTVPLFSFHSHEPGLSDESSIPLSPSTSRVPRKEPIRNVALPDDQRDPLYYDPPRSSLEISIYYAEPLFVFCSFFGLQMDKPHRVDRFMPRARCYELFSQGVGDRTPIAIPLLPSAAEYGREEEGLNFLGEKEKRMLRRERYDAAAVGAKDNGELGGWVRQSGTSGASESDGDAKIVEESRGRKAIAIRRNRSGTGTSDKRTEVIREERSKTPMGRPPPRSTSKSASIRTISSTFPRPDSRLSKAPTPALISRLTAPKVAGVGWLGIFKSGITAAPAPSVSVSRIEAQANVKADLDIDTESSKSSKANSIRAPSPSKSFRTIPRNVDLVPSQPISISTRAAQTKEADQPITSSSLKKYPSGKSSGLKALDSRFNPSKPGKRSLGLADQARRWASIFIRHSNDQRSVNWISITRTACLPITTDYLPTAEALSTQYQVNRYSIPTAAATSSFLLRTDNARRSPALELVTELISQRLSHGFQICTPANALGALDEINLATDKTIPQVLRDIDEGELSAVYLSLSNQIHRISYDQPTQCVVVKICRRRRTWAKHDYDYGGLFWTLGAKVWDYSNLNFPYPDMIDPLDWEHLDRLVAGLEKPEIGPSLRYWRTRLVLLPADTIADREFLTSKLKGGEGGLTDEAIQLQGFTAFMDLIQAARWSAPGVEKEPTPTEVTTLSPPEWALKVAREAANASYATEGVQARTSRWLRKVTPSSRSEVGGGGGGSESNERDRSMSPKGRRDASPSRTRPIVQMTYSVILDLDLQQRSGRAERVLCHFDKSHNPNAAYHVELTWLAGSGKIIDSNIQSWTRAVGRYGLNLIEVGTREVTSNHNPFQRALKVGLALDPPSTIEGQPINFYEIEILKKLGFFLDVGGEHTFSPEVRIEYSYRPTVTAQSQYIHRNGTLLVSILGGKEGFACQPNRIFLSHSKGSCEDILRRLRELAGDARELRKLWNLPETVEEEEVVVEVV